jgi:methionyl-tRNA synthetase
MPETTGKKKFYLTTPIYYANSRPHVGSAYTTIVCDVIARYKRMCGYDVAYLTGTDEHGVNIERAAEKAGISPAELVDCNQKIFVELWKLLGIQYTDFVRTTSPQHAIAVQNLVRRTQRVSPEAIFKRRYEGRYCIYDNLYISDTPEPADCPNCGRPGELVSEDNYFFRLSAYGPKLLEFYKEHSQFVYPDFRFNEVKSFVESGLRDLSISRKSIKWGIPWPGDPEHVFYVWYDALSSYMSGIGFVDGEPDSRKDSARFKRFWPADIHAIGKEIIRFHAVYWPAFLMAAFADRPLAECMPKQIVAHGWLLFEQEKMSKSKGNVAYPEPIVKVLGNDALRYYLLREVVFGQDGNFSRDALLTRYEADLANGVGNLVSRTLKMVEQYFGGSVPAAPLAASQETQQLMGFIARAVVPYVPDYYDRFEFSLALKEVWQFITQVDWYLTTKAPWKIAKDPERGNELAEILYNAVEALRLITVLIYPVMPDTALRMWECLGQRSQLALENPKHLVWGQLAAGTQILVPEALFPRFDFQAMSERIEAMENEIRNPGAAAPATTSSTPAGGATAAGAPTGAAAGTGAAAAPVPGAKITIDDFAKVELRVGLVKSAEKVQGADKLLKVMVDIGDEVRQVLAGIALAYAPEELVGRKVVVVTNLAPRKMRGQESNGMLLAASDGADGKPVLVTFAEDIPAGAKVK